MHIYNNWKPIKYYINIYVFSIEFIHEYENLSELSVKSEKYHLTKKKHATKSLLNKGKIYISFLKISPPDKQNFI